MAVASAAPVATKVATDPCQSVIILHQVIIGLATNKAKTVHSVTSDLAASTKSLGVPPGVAVRVDGVDLRRTLH